MGLTKREEFALAAMSAFLRDPATNLEAEGEPGMIARRSVRMADLMVDTLGTSAAQEYAQSVASNQDALPYGYYWAGKGDVRHDRSHLGARIDGDHLSFKELGNAVHVHLDAVAALLRVAGYPVGERVKP